MFKLTARLTLITMIALVFSLSAEAQVVINELGIAPSNGDAAGGGEFIELYNKGGCTGAVDISCYVIMFTSQSTGGNATGFTITIPSGTVLQPCSYYLIGGSGLSPSTAWTALAIGGNAWINNSGANGRAADLDISNAYNSGLNGLRPGNLVNSKGQVSLLTPSGSVVASVSYNTGYNAASFPGSLSNPSPGCTAISPIPATGAAAVNITGTFSGSGTQGIYLDATGNYQTETSFTPGKTNTLNGGTQTCCNPTITAATSTPSRCFSSSAQTTTLAYTATTNSPTTYSITWNATPANSFVAVTNAALPASPITINIPAGTPAGTYTGNLTVQNAGGCSSCSTPFTVTITNQVTSTTNIAVCPSQLPYTWNGHTYTAAGTYSVTLISSTGCDSVATLVLSVKPNTTSTTNIGVCPALLPYSWNGHTYTAAGTYSVTLVNAAGCDSIATLNLSVGAIATSTTNASICSNQIPYTWNGNNYNTSGSYSVTLVSSVGCDSIATLNLQVRPVSTSTTNLSLCSAQIPYTWNGHTYTASGSYAVTLINAVGCDSVATLNLTIRPNSSSTTNISVCSNQMPYSWNGNTYTAAGTYSVTLVNSVACDSIATLVLTVKSTSSSTTNISVCNNQIPYTWNAHTYTAGGTYNVTLVNAAGCDSIATLNLTVRLVTTSITNISVCPAQMPYTWNAHTYTAGGTYNVTLVNAAGCDSIATLVLTVKPNSTSSTSVSVCPAQMPYTWNANTYTAGGTYNVTLVNAAGCDSVATLVLTVKPNSASSTSVSVCPAQMPYTWNAQTYTAAGTYNVTLINAAGCDSIATLVLTVKPNSTSSTSVAVCSTQLPYTWNGQNYTVAGTYNATLVNTAGCDSIATLQLIVNQLNPLPTLRADTTLCPGDIVVLTPGLYYQYLWQNNSTLSSFSVSNAGHYTVQVSDVNGCKASAGVTISYYPSCTDIYFPTGFTPNGDGRNDSFGPLGNLATIKTFTLKVFDRWGQMVFNSNNPSKSWSGNSANNNLNTAAVFVWYAEYTLVNGTVYKKKGLVTKIL